MTPIWHDGPLDGLDWDGTSPVAWRVADPGRGRRQPLVAALLARLTGEAAAAVHLARDAAGAPYVAHPPGWHIGLSGRGDHGLIGAARQPIAVDRELVDDAPPLWDMLTEREAHDLRQIPAAGQPRAWLRRWTIKEAHAKLVGTPRRLAPEAIDTRLIDATRATADCEGRSDCWTRDTGDAIETLACWSAA